MQKRKIQGGYPQHRIFEVLMILAKNKGDVKATSKEVGISRNTISKWRDKYGTETSTAIVQQIKDKQDQETEKEITEATIAFIENSPYKETARETRKALLQALIKSLNRPNPIRDLAFALKVVHEIIEFPGGEEEHSKSPKEPVFATILQQFKTENIQINNINNEPTGN